MSEPSATNVQDTPNVTEVPPVTDAPQDATKDEPVDLGDGRLVHEHDGATFYQDEHGSVYTTPGSYSDVVIALRNLNLL